MPPDRPPLPASVLAALGLVSVTGCGPCLSLVAEHSGTEHTGDTVTTQVCLQFVYEHTGTVGPCLGIPRHSGTPETGDTAGGSGAPGHSGGSGGSGAAGAAAAPSPTPTPTVFERLSAEGVLPPDVVERLGRRGR